MLFNCVRSRKLHVPHRMGFQGALSLRLYSIWSHATVCELLLDYWKQLWVTSYTHRNRWYFWISWLGDGELLLVQTMQTAVHWSSPHFGYPVFSGQAFTPYRITFYSSTEQFCLYYTRKFFITAQNPSSIVWTQKVQRLATALTDSKEF